MQVNLQICLKLINQWLKHYIYVYSRTDTLCFWKWSGTVAKTGFDFILYSFFSHFSKCVLLFLVISLKSHSISLCIALLLLSTMLLWCIHVVHVSICYILLLSSTLLYECATDIGHVPVNDLTVYSSALQKRISKGCILFFYSHLVWFLSKPT